MSQINQHPENPPKHRFGKQYLGPLHPLESDVWQSSNIFAFPNKQDEYAGIDAHAEQHEKDLQQDGGIDAPSNSGLGVSMANMLFDSKDPTSAASNTTSSQSHQAFVSGLTQHFESLSLHGDDSRARNGGAAGGYEQAAMPTFPIAHVAVVPPRPGPGDDVHLQPQLAVPQHPHIPYFPIYPHMLPPGASDVRYVPVDTTHPAMDASYAQQYAGIPAISTAGGIMAIPSMPYVQLMPMVQQPISSEDGSVEGVSQPAITYPPPNAAYPAAARIVHGQLIMNGMMPQGYLWDMYRHPAMPVPHSESFRDKRERRKRVERARELITVQGLSTEALQEVRGNVHKLSKDQAGCRLLQQLLDESSEEIRDLIFKEARPHLCELMTDAFGNYLFQKLLETADDEQRTNILETVSTRMLGAALNLHGTRSVQKLVELCSSTRKQIDIIKSALRQNVVRLCVDANGNHVVQRALLHLGPQDNDFIFDAVRESCVKVSTHRHGCCVMQRCLDAARDDQRVALVHEIGNNALALMQNPYGNYVVQYVLDLCGPDEAWGICTAVCGRLALLSMQKFSSNVVEKCFEKATPDIQAAFVAEMTRPEVIVQMMEDQFANYVVQRALTVCPHPQAQVIVEAIKPHLQTMRHTSGGRRIINKILKRFPMALQNEILAGILPGTSLPPTSVQDAARTRPVIHIAMAPHMMTTQSTAL